MPIIRVETLLSVSPEACFDLARDIGIHCQTTAWTRERAVPPGRTSGLLERGDTVTFEAVHLGVRQRLTAKIVEYDRPYRFVDAMQRGAFKMMHHTHEFFPTKNGVLMRDTLEWTAPLGAIGVLADTLFLKRYMRRFLERRNAGLKKIAEANGFH